MQVDGFKIRSGLGKIHSSLSSRKTNSSSFGKDYSIEIAQKSKDIKQEETKEEAKPPMKAKPKIFVALKNKETKPDEQIKEETKQEEPKKEETKTRPKINVTLKNKETKSEEPIKEETGPAEPGKGEVKARPKITVALKN